MSAKVPSPRSLEVAVLYALGLSTNPKQSGDEVNVGDGCASCNAAGAQKCVCQASPMPWPSGFPVPPGWSVGAGGVLIAPNGGTMTPDSSAPATLPPAGQYPANFKPADWREYLAAGGPGGMFNCVPYQDAIRDGLMMSMVQSDPTTIATGVTSNIDIQALNGWVDGYYLDISARTAAGVALPPEAVSLTPPRNVGCPVPACTRDVATSGRFFRSDQGCCLGKPYRSILTEQSNGTPLRAAVTNHTAADAIVQIVVRGFCISTRICV